MTTGFDQLERELAAAEQRLTRGSEAGALQPRRRASVLIPALAVIVTLVVAGGAVALLGGGTHRASPAHRGGPHSSTTAPRRVDTYPSSAAGFVQLLGVLRRPQTAADRTSPLLRNASNSGLTLVRADVRRATTTRGGEDVFVIVAHEKQRAGQAAATRVLLEVGAGFDPFSVADVESGRASFSAGRSPASEQTFVLVPDGVARVVFAGGGPADQTPVSADVHGNVAVFDTTELADSPRNMRWYSATDKAIPIHDHPDPTPPPYPVNASGQTYGSDTNQPAGRVRPGEEPDLILVTGKSTHDTGHVTGYVRGTQLNTDDCGDVHTPKQAVACTRRTSRKTRTIPVYAKNGKTIIGTFTTGG
jgi:hypothetical protein